MAVTSARRSPDAPPPGVSFWFDSLPGAKLPPRAPLDGDTAADVAIVGAGYTGLWTAYYLHAIDPNRRVVVVEAQRAGFGASGRNGGWCTSEMPAGIMTMVRAHGLYAALQLFRAGRKTLGEIQRVTAEEGIDCGWQQDGTMYLARTEPQAARLSAWHEMRTALRMPGLTLLDPAEIGERIGAEGVLAAGYNPHCAVLQPARLAVGLADAVARRGVRIAEGTRALDIRPGLVRTDHGTVRAPVVVCATEGYTGRLGGHARRVVPLYSHMIATEPVPAELWTKLGWTDRKALADSHYRYAYLQRTACDRIVIGGRDIGYHFGSRTGPRFDRNDPLRELLRRTLVDLFPATVDVPVAYQWGGAFALHRDSVPAVSYDESTGLAHAGGYGGEGVALSNLAGRTLAALITGADRPEARLCWTRHRTRRWEPEPLRFIGVRGITALAGSADRFEDRTGRPARLRGKISSRATV